MQRFHLGPNAAAGALGATVTGGLMAVLASTAGGLSGSVLGILVLTAVLVAAGVFYGRLLDSGRMRAGFGPGILFWVVAFPVARMTHELMVGFSEKGMAGGVFEFAVYQAMVGGAFGLGFVLLHTVIAGLLGEESEVDERGPAG
jgi:hypothetical protein